MRKAAARVLSETRPRSRHRHVASRQGGPTRKGGTPIDLPFRTIFESSPAPMAAAAVDGTLIDVNPSFARLLGHRRALLRGRNVADVSHPDDAEATRATIARVARTKRAATIDKRYRRRDGGDVHAITSLVSVHDEDGSLLYVLATLQDLTDKVRAEAAARQSEAELHQFAEHVHDGVWISDRDRRHFTFLSETTARLWGLERGHLLADPYFLLTMIHPGDLERATAAVGGIDEGPVEVRVRVTPPGQQMRWLRVRMFPIRDATGRVTRVAGLTEEVTDQQRAAELLEQTQRQAIRLVQALQEPMGVLSRVLGSTTDADEGTDVLLSATTVADSIDRERIREFARRETTLTGREREVMHLIVAGRTTRQIADELRLSPKTVETHRAHLLRKTGVASIAELVRLVVLGVRKPPSE